MCAVYTINCMTHTDKMWIENFLKYSDLQLNERRIRTNAMVLTF